MSRDDEENNEFHEDDHMISDIKGSDDEILSNVFNISEENDCDPIELNLKNHISEPIPIDPDLGTHKRKRAPRTKFPFDCHNCGKTISDRKCKLTHPCLMKGKIAFAVSGITDEEGKLDQSQLVKFYGNNSESEDINGGNFICHLCGINFPSKASLSNHVKMQCSNVCEICKEVFSSKTEVKTHIFQVHRMVTKMRNMENTKLSEECEECGKRYSNKTVLGLHIKNAHTKDGLEKVQCNECGKLFSNKGALKKHSSLHRPPELPCPICGKLFHNSQYLLRHAMSAHGNDSDKKHKCDICNKGFDNLTTLEGHKNWHLNLKPYKCRWCDRTYQNQPNCAAHERKRHAEEYRALLTVKHRKVAVFTNS